MQPVIMQRRKGGGNSKIIPTLMCKCIVHLDFKPISYKNNNLVAQLRQYSSR